MTLDRDRTALLIVSGSNMSGKSTLLRSIGVNAVLALAGAPVRARSLRLTPLHLGASIRTQDSLQGGISRFYAEILRLRQIVDIGRGAAARCCFCIDEILHGTNSHDRRAGTEAVARALVRRGRTRPDHHPRSGPGRAGRRPGPAARTTSTLRTR